MAGVVNGKAQAFVESLVKAIAEVFSQALSSTWSVEMITEPPPSSADDSCLCISLAASGGLLGTAAFEMKKADALLLAHKFLAEPVDETSTLDEGRQEAVEELMRQVAGVAATGMKNTFGEMQLQVGRDTIPATGATVLLVVSEGSARKMPIALRLSADLLANASEHQNVKAVATDDRRETEEDTDRDGTERVLGVRLKLSLRFGHRLLTLGEILDLRSGTVVELDQQVKDPVELVIGKKVIARGHVVVVDANYGLQVTEAVESDSPGGLKFEEARRLLGSSPLVINKLGKVSEGIGRFSTTQNTP